MKIRFRHRPRNVLQELNQRLARFVRLNNRIDPATRRAVANIRLFLVTALHFLTKLVQLFVRRFFVAALDLKGALSRLESAEFTEPA